MSHNYESLINFKFYKEMGNTPISLYDAGDLPDGGNINSRDTQAPELQWDNLLNGQGNFGLGAAWPADAKRCS
jgi:hypothetical protein